MKIIAIVITYIQLALVPATLVAQDKTSTSVSIGISDESYMLRAKFPAEKFPDLEEVLMQEMNMDKMEISKGKQVWSSTSNGEEVYEVILSNTKLYMFLNKEIASSGLVNKFENLGATIRSLVASAQDEEIRQVEKLQREADRLRAEADRMQREADRIQKSATKSELDNRYLEDAERIAEEARRLAEEASELNMEASHKGGVSAMIKELLRENRTYYGKEVKNANNWTWPAAQKELISALLSEGLIKSEDEISFTKDETGGYVNGKKLTTDQMNRYSRIFSAYGLSKIGGFSFYKAGEHIVLITSNADIEGFLDDMVSHGHLSSKRAKVKLEINGISAFKGGVQVSENELLAYNELMLKNNIIPAPGKILEIMKPGSYKLGYTVGTKTHLGTWQF